jgi:IS1 family transposase/transposase-like protein
MDCRYKRKEFVCNFKTQFDGLTMLLEPKTGILPEAQKKIWPCFQDMSKDFVLYGGTAVALRYGHRTSVDFDFFTSRQGIDLKKIGESIPIINTLPHETILVSKNESVDIKIYLRHNCPIENRGGQVMPECKNCKSEKVVKSGKIRGKQRYKCKECGYNFVIGDARTNDKIVALKALCVLLYSLGKASYNMMGKLFGRNRSLIYRWIRDAGLNMDEPVVGDEITQTVKKKKLWLIKALDRGSRRTIAWVLGGRDSATFKRLYDKVTHLKNCLFYTDNWNTFADVLPPERHIIGKSETHAFERDSSNTRHHLGVCFNET